MKIHDNIKDFMNSTNKEISFSFTQYHDTEIFIAEKEQLNDDIYCMFLYKDPGDIESKIEKIYAFTYDSDGNILHINRTGTYDIAPLMDVSWDEINEFNIQKKIKKQVQENLDLYFEKNKNKFIEKFDFETIFDITAKSYMDKHVISKPEIDFDIKLTKNLLKDFLLNKDSLIKTITNEQIKAYEEQYKEYIIQTEARKRYIKGLEENGKEAAKNEILKIYNNNKYKNATFYITYPDKYTETIKDSVDTYNGQDGIKIGLFHSDIPISCIDKIKWSKQEIYNKKNIKNYNPTEADIIQDLIEAKNYNHFPEEKYSDKDFISNILINNPYAVSSIETPLTKNKDFLVELLNKVDDPLLIICKMAKEGFLKDKTFANEMINYLIDNNIDVRYKTLEIIEGLDVGSLNDIEIFKKIFKINGLAPGKTIKFLLQNMNETFINSKDFKDNIELFILDKNETVYWGRIKDNKLCSTIFPKIHDAEVIYNIFHANTILENANSLYDDIKYDKEFVLNLFYNYDDSDHVDIENYENLVRAYKNDNDILNNIAIHFNGLDTHMFFKYLDIEEVELMNPKDEKKLDDMTLNEKEEYKKRQIYMEKILEFSYINALFLNHIKNDEIRYSFLVGNLIACENYQIEDDKLIVKDEIFTFKIPINGYQSGSYYDNHGHKYSISIIDTEKLREDLRNDLINETMPELQKIPNIRSMPFEKFAHLVVKEKETKKEIDER